MCKAKQVDSILILLKRKTIFSVNVNVNVNVNVLDVDECSDRSSCGREASCQNAAGSFDCKCFNGSPFNAATR